VKLKKIIINADDFGLTESVNQAIINIFKQNNINSTTMMVNMPGTINAVVLAKENPGLKVGLHFCITEGLALTGVSTLTDKTGNFISRPDLLMRILQRRVKRCDIQQEFSAQLEKFESFKIPISHIDSHQHLHMVPQVFNAIIPMVEKRGLPMRIVCPVLKHRLILKRPIKYFKQIINSVIAKHLRKKFTGKSNDCLISIFDLESLDGVSADIYERLIGDTGGHEIVELMVHPFILEKDIMSMYKETMKDKLGFLKTCELEYSCLAGHRVIRDPSNVVVGYSDV
jgi:chitin disaccharide deacetylase